MLYRSTRGGSEKISAAGAIIRGAASNGGLFAPEAFPRCTPDNLENLSYRRLAYDILKLYLTDFSDSELSGCVDAAYAGNFDGADIAPLTRRGDVWFLELFHGPTLAFKDIALSILPRFMSAAKKKLGIEEEIAILTATSGDTGGAALAGFAGAAGFKAVAFYPEGGVSDVQRLQMVTRPEKNVCAFGVRGNFDDTQRGVKAIFSDAETAALLKKRGIVLSSANSINIGRLLPQIVYYYYAYAQLLKRGEITAGEKVNFAVPTGNFGNILAGWYAGRMGLPVGTLLCASNINNVLYDFFETGDYNARREFKLTSSPSMDILVSSNLERLLYHLSGGNGGLIAGLMGGLSRDGRYRFNAPPSGILSAFADEDETFSALRRSASAGYVIDPHTAVALASYEKSGISGKTVVISTASPHKFIPALKRAGVSPPDSPPAQIAGLDTRPVIHGGVCGKDEMKQAVLGVLGV
jgi:threonine synthase